MSPRETVRPSCEGSDINVSHGLPFPEACAKHVTETLGASRVYVIASKSLSESTDALERLKDALGDKLAGVRVGMAPHSLWSEILEVKEDVAKAKADAIVTIGGSSLSDSAKIIAFALANDAHTQDDLEKLNDGGKKKVPTVRVICIPTSLSGAEYQRLAAGTRDSDDAKIAYKEDILPPAVVILDPELSTTTPEWVWLSTGVRSVDHCVEAMCSLQGNDAADRSAAEGLKLLVPGLLRSKRDPKDLAARLDCQLGVVEAMAAVKNGVPMGASHAIGHQLGPLGVGHGETSCILLPAVCRFNKSVNGKQQEKVLGLVWADGEAEAVLKARGLQREKSDLGDVLDAIIRELGMPRTLKEKGIGRDKLDGLAKNSLDDWWIKTNPIEITEKGQVMEILERVIE